MDRERITNDVLKELEPQPKPYEYRDPDLKGFLARIQPTGLIVFYAQYRNRAGTMSRVRLGRWPAMSASQARKAAKEHLAQVTMGEDPADDLREDKAARESMTLRAFIVSEWSPHYRAHRRAHDKQLRRLLSAFAPLLDRRLKTLTTRDFEKHREARATQSIALRGTKIPSPATLNRCNATMRPVLELAKRRGLIDVNPLAGVAKATEDPNPAIRAMSAEEEAAIMQVFENRRNARIQEYADINARRAKSGKRLLPAPPHFINFLEPCFVLSIETGIRRGEAFNLKWGDVDLVNRKINIPKETAKSKKNRTIPLSTRALEALSAWRKQCPDDAVLVFPSRIGGGVMGSIDTAWRNLLKDAGVTGLRWHDIRHTFGSRAATKGGGINVIKDVMGHSSIITTQKYLHATSTDAERLIALMEGR